MPDRYGDEPADDHPFSPLFNSRPTGAESLQREAERILRAAEIERCGLCDAEGYLGSTVCDHRDHAEAAKRGMELVREAMGWQTP